MTIFCILTTYSYAKSGYRQFHILFPGIPVLCKNTRKRTAAFAAVRPSFMIYSVNNGVE